MLHREIKEAIRGLTSSIKNIDAAMVVPPDKIAYIVFRRSSSHSFGVDYTLVGVSELHPGFYIYKLNEICGLASAARDGVELFLARYILWDINNPKEAPNIWRTTVPQPSGYVVEFANFL